MIVRSSHLVQDKGWCLLFFAAPACTEGYSAWQTSANEWMKRYQPCFNSQPLYPAMTHCRIVHTTFPTSVHYAGYRESFKALCFWKQNRWCRCPEKLCPRGVGRWKCRSGLYGVKDSSLILLLVGFWKEYLTHWQSCLLIRIVLNLLILIKSSVPCFTSEEK